MLYLLAAYKWEEIEMVEMRLSENAHLPFGRLTALSKVEGLRYPYPSSLRRTSMYASLLGISEALHLDIFHQPLRSRFFDSLNINQGYPHVNSLRT